MESVDLLHNSDPPSCNFKMHIAYLFKIFQQVGYAF
jgi:hypothetical protein